MPGEMLHIASLVETMRAVSTSLKEKVKCRHYCVTNLIFVVEFEREKLSGDDSPAGLKKKVVCRCLTYFWSGLWCGIHWMINHLQ